VSVFATHLSKYLLVTIALLCLGQLAVVPAQAQKQITACGTVIRSSGSYHLANDLLNCPGDGIVITDSWVQVYLEGHRITGSGSGTGILVANGYSFVEDVSISKGSIANFDTGIDISNSSRGYVHEVTCTGNNIGFRIRGWNGAPYPNDIILNLATMNHFAGFVVGGRIDYYYANEASENGNGFVLVDKETLANTLTNNIADHNIDYGIVALPGAAYNDIVHNDAFRNSKFDLADDNNGCPNKWEDNIYRTHNKDCVK
jgi:hypothetical protein